jgi:hypothetical protein
MNLNGRETTTNQTPQAANTAVDAEHIKNYVPPMFNREDTMFRAVVEEAAALASITLFVGMIAVWAQVLPSVLSSMM